MTRLWARIADHLIPDTALRFDWRRPLTAGDGDLKVIRLGTAVRVRRSDLDTYVEQLEPSGEIAELPEWITELARQGRKERRR